jgi:hypothetical protein
MWDLKWWENGRSLLLRTDLRKKKFTTGILKTIPKL